MTADDLGNELAKQWSKGAERLIPHSPVTIARRDYERVLERRAVVAAELVALRTKVHELTKGFNQIERDVATAYEVLKDEIIRAENGLLGERVAEPDPYIWRRDSQLDDMSENSLMM